MKQLLLPISLIMITLGTVLVFIGVLSASTFYPGIYLIAIGMLVLAVAGVWRMLKPEAEA
jgi:hypothetical protein